MIHKKRVQKRRQFSYCLKNSPEKVNLVIKSSFLAIPSRPQKQGEAIAKHYLFEIVIYYKKVHKNCNFGIEALKCFSKNPHALTWGENELTRFRGLKHHTYPA